ncbi:MAG: 2-oxoacid:acceptor oxidoreductase family protein [Candidatus Marinimicrobia bacterium]|nr:2-oxoacid:acceptor oxidoreductase family protein [Candidatus Neomarinimicrobiota bacterium]
MKEQKIKISGFGGQGVILSAYIIGKAASIYDGKNASMTQAYGPEARGGACSSQVVISPKEVDYPLVDEADVLIALSQEGYDKFISILKKDGILLYDSDLVENLKHSSKINSNPLPVTRVAEELGNKIVANVVMMGFFTAVAKMVSIEAMKQSIQESVPSKYTELNMRAFDEGYNYIKNLK